MDWDDLRVFLTLAREGNLTAAARRLHISHPTVARRVKGLEDAVGARLFDRLPDRFVLTAAGEELLADSEAMERAAESIERRSAGLGDTSHGTVRVSAGEAMAGFLADHMPRLRRGLQCIEIELAASHMLVNLSRREADLMIREQVPDIPSLVARRLGRVDYAVYAARGREVADATPEGLRRLTWAGFDEQHAYMPGQAWVAELLDGARPAVRVNDWLVLQQVLRSGEAVGLLPCHRGDADPGLRRLGPVVEEVGVDQWLLVHRDLRALSRVRRVMESLVSLFRERRDLLEGRMPQEVTVP